MTRRRPVLTASPPAPIDLNPRTDPALDFPDRELAAMTPQDWDELGFRCGLEVHQQLDTRGKLFCRCPAGVRSTRVDLEVLRHMRPTLSEMGEYDGTALMEFKTKKEIVYQLDRRTVCTYEIDDTPPFPIDEQAVRIALEVARLVGCSPVSELQVMRKQYLDGSIPTGFQRTTMIGLGGVVPLAESELGSDQVMRIRQLTLEEDSCREVEDLGHRITFRTDRLGVPLIETVTEPDLLTPADVAAGGRVLAAIARASGKVRRGAGAGRQDVNVSIAGSRRVELKGVSHHKGLPLLVHNEAFRHLNLLRIRERLRERGVDPALFEVTPGAEAVESPLVIDVTRSLPRSPWKPFTRARERGDTILALRLPGFAGLIAHPTQPGRTFGHEIAERVRVIACPVAAHWWASSDELPGAGKGFWRELRAALQADADDAIGLVWAPGDDADTAALEVLIRCADAFVGVPSETRQAFPDGTTGFERILPGPERMYPDTDTPPVPIPDAWLEGLERLDVRRPWTRADAFERRGLPPAAARRLARARWVALFEELDPRTEVCARRLAAALEKRLVRHWRVTGTRAMPAAERLVPLVRAVDAGRVRPEAFEAAFDELLVAPLDEAASLVERYAAGPDDEAELARRLEGLVRLKPVARHGSEAYGRALMGRVMPEFLGRLDPRLVRARLAEALTREAPEVRS